jgi:hypothetical protein
MRTNARLDHKIRQDIKTVKARAGAGLKAIHLIECDFARVVHDPTYFDATKQEDGRIVTVLNGRLIEVVALA